MNLAIHPGESYEKIGKNPQFPRIIIFSREKCKPDVQREYKKCGCYVHYPTPSVSIPAFCTLHDGRAPCFLSKKRQHRKMRKMIAEYDRDLEDTQFKRRILLKKLERDKSPERV
jgi:hypothetical protein